jgi:hypothetical protein
VPDRFVCPRCGESSNVEVIPFLDDEGRAKIRLTCRLIVHEEPVVQEFDDPFVPRGAQLTPADGLVHDLDLYSKLETIVLGLEQPSEYGIVEHHFAYAHPDDYVTLWRRYGHVATHGSKRYTLSAYLSRLLGNLTRHGSIGHRGCRGTGRWAYNADISAWANPSRADGPLLTWATFAEEHDWSPDAWPAVELLPAEELPQRSAADAFWVYDNRVHHYARLHRADCAYCNAGAGIHADSADVAGEWLGPYVSLDDALEVAARTGRDVAECKACSPSLV